MIRRQFLRSLFAAPIAAVAAVAVGAGALAQPPAPRGFFKQPRMTPEFRAEFERVFINPIVNDLKVAGRDRSGEPNMWWGKDGVLLDRTVSRRTAT